MPNTEIEERNKFFKMVSSGNTLAEDWLILFHAYMHEIDDIIDTPDFSSERVLSIFEFANRIYSHPFYSLNRKALGPAILVATSVYQDANKWEKEPMLWKKWWADVMRHSGNQVFMTVAQLCGGWTHMKGLTASMASMSYIYHADKYGTPS